MMTGGLESVMGEALAGDLLRTKERLERLLAEDPCGLEMPNTHAGALQNLAAAEVILENLSRVTERVECLAQSGQNPTEAHHNLKQLRCSLRRIRDNLRQLHSVRRPAFRSSLERSPARIAVHSGTHRDPEEGA